MNVAQAFGLQGDTQLLNESSEVLVSDDKVGVEIELEGLPVGVPRLVESMRDPRWTHDPEERSVRTGNGMSGGELLFSSPLFGKDVVVALDTLERTMESLNPYFSKRTSVHVHLDVRDMDEVQLYNMIIIYCLLEDLLFYIAGEHRKNNFYCIPLSNNTSYMNYLSTFLGEGRSFENMSNDLNVKYCALNLKPISTFGSVEFRHHEGTVDSGRILRWINIIQSIKTYAYQFIERLTANQVEEMVLNLDSFLSQVFSSDLVTLTEDEVAVVNHTCVSKAKLLINYSSAPYVDYLVEPTSIDPRHPLIQAMYGIREGEILEPYLEDFKRRVNNHRSNRIHSNNTSGRGVRERDIFFDVFRTRPPTPNLHRIISDD